MSVDPRTLIRLQKNQINIRNICIMAHVDHGKTSLSDCLLASNGIISQNMQGQIRYLDSRADEQLRGITMEASAISLLFLLPKPPVAEATGPPEREEYLVNLIDSPGHIDFSSEVSCSSRLCDGAVILVDAVEGVCSQTVTVLKQAFDDKLKTILVINKVDRLIHDLQMTPLEAYNSLTQLIQDVNALLATFLAGQRMEEEYRLSKTNQTHPETDLDADAEIYFDPVKNNVIFASAIDGWGFTIAQFAAIFERKLGVKREKLQQVLWGDFHLDLKTKKVTKGFKKNAKPMFVQFILENIWAVYKAISTQDVEKLTKICASINIKMTEKEIKTLLQESKRLTSSIFSQWIPVSRAVLTSVARSLPSPKAAQLERTKFILESTPSFESIDPKIFQGIAECDPDAPLVAFIPKVQQVPESDIVRDLTTDKIQALRLHSLQSQGGAEVVVGFARVYSGTVKVGDTVSLLSPLYDPAKDTLDNTPESDPHAARTDVTIDGLFILMGKGMIPVEKACAGSIIGITGLDKKIVKSATIVASSFKGPNFSATNHIHPPILHVAVEPVKCTEIPELVRGLELLDVSDPSVTVELSDQGEYILGTSGELHLERCLDDLKERFARVEIEASKPVVPYRETITQDGEWEPKEENPDAQRGQVSFSVGDVVLDTRVVPMPSAVLDLLQELKCSENESLSDDQGGQCKHALEQLTGVEFDITLAQLAERLVAFGPRGFGLNMLVDMTAENSIKLRAFDQENDKLWGTYDHSIVSGFQAAMAKGPLVAETVEGVICVITSLRENSTEVASTFAQRRIISAMREAIYEGMVHWSPRLLLAMYKCDIQASTDVLGKVYGVVHGHKGKIITEELKDGTPFFNVTARIPVAESFGFSEEVRKRTSGAANPQLVFDGFTVLDQDPYWVPTTEEELEDLGATADKENSALMYVQAIRRRKGLRTNEKVVEYAERQRTHRH